jgi:hypothetical protein
LGLVLDERDTRQPGKHPRVEDRIGLGEVPGASKKENRDERMGSLRTGLLQRGSLQTGCAAARQTENYRDDAEHQVERKMAYPMDAMEQQEFNGDVAEHRGTRHTSNPMVAMEQQANSMDAMEQQELLKRIKWMLTSSRNYPERIRSIQ